MHASTASIAPPARPAPARTGKFCRLLVAGITAASLAPAAMRAEEFELVGSSFAPMAQASGGDFSLDLVQRFGPVPTGAISGDDFTLVGADFWSWTSVGELRLQLTRLPDDRLELKFTGTGLTLESSTDLRDWSPATGVATGPGTVVVEPTAGRQFFRLRP